MREPVPCIRCDERGTTVAVELRDLIVYLDLCEGHLNDLLEGARAVSPVSTSDLAATNGSARR